MTRVDGEARGGAVDRTDTEAWVFTENVAVRALLDHVAEELAAEFVRLMRASVSGGAEPSTSNGGDK